MSTHRKKTPLTGGQILSAELKTIWRRSYDLCVKKGHLDDARARRFADTTVEGVNEAYRALATN